MTIERALIGTTDAASGPAVYVEDVFSTYLYSGTGASQTITNNIDLSTKGGMVWMKCRSASTTDHAIYDTTRGATYDIGSNLSTGQTTQSTGLTAFGTTGFTIGALAKINTSAATYASWTFREQAKFFDVVTYTGNGSNRTISHNLGATPGMIIVKRTDTTGSWKVYHNSLTSASYYCDLNATTAQTSDTTVWNATAPTSSVFSVGTHVDVNANTGTYVAYLFAASSSGGFGLSGTDSIVACGSFTTASGTVDVTLGWEPQYVLLKRSASAGGWFCIDTMRGQSYSMNNTLNPNLADAEVAQGAGNFATPTATGFKVDSAMLGTGYSYIYLAIRRGPMKTPTDATKVYNCIARTGNGATTATDTGIGFPPDCAFIKTRSVSTNGFDYDRMRGNDNYLLFDTIDAESGAGGGGLSFTAATGTVVIGGTVGWHNESGRTFVDWYFRRAPGFLDVVCYTGTGSNTTITHNLGVAPELIIVKKRGVNSTTGWLTYNSTIGAGNKLYLNLTNASAADSTAWNSTIPTSSVFSVGTNADCNTSAATYIAYLFATLSGVSKVGSYTGTGNAQNINCGFSAGARFVMIKRTDAAGDWYVWDSARGINASGSNDPYLLLNSTAVEVTNTDYLGTFSSGFALTASAPAALNANTKSYIYLAIA